jgi:hypothetical protein
MKYLLPIAGKREKYFRKGQGYTDELIRDVLELNNIAFQKIPSCRYIEKKIFHADGTAYTATAWPLSQDLAVLNFYFGSQLILFPSGAQQYLGNGSNRGQCLAPEAHGLDFLEVFNSGNLGGGMPFKTIPCVFLAHPLSIVHDLQNSLARIFHNQPDFCSPCIHGIFKQLFHRTARTLDDFSSSNLVGNMGGEELDEIGHGGLGVERFKGLGVEGFKGLGVEGFKGLGVEGFKGLEQLKEFHWFFICCLL